MATSLIAAFNGGEASRNLESRRDLGLYGRLCSIAENVDILSEGGAISRAGTKFIAETKDGEKAYLRPFSYSDEYSYVMEIGDEYMRIYNNQTEALVDEIATPWALEDVPELDMYRSYDVMWIAHKDYPTQILTRTAVDAFSIEEIEFDYPPLLEPNTTDTTLSITDTATAWATSTVYAAGAYVTNSGTRYRCLIAHTSGTFTTDLAAGKWVADISIVGTGLTLTSSTDYFDVDHAGAIFSISHQRAAAQNSVNGSSAATFQSTALDVSFCNWRVETGGTWNGRLIVERSFDGGVTWVAGELIGDTTGIAAANFSFDTPIREKGNTLVRLNWIRSSGTMTYNLSCIDLFTYGLVEVKSITSAKIAVVDVISTIGATTATVRWSEGAFSEYRGYPRTVSRHEDRLVFSGTRTEPNMIWMSFTGDYYNFFAGTLADEAIRRGPATNGFTSWLVSKGDLFIGTSNELITLLPMNSNQQITPENLKFNTESSFGGAYRAPVLANNIVLYLQKNGQTIREILYDDNSKSYVSQDVSRIAKHITAQGVEEIILMRLPEQRLHCILGNGEKGVLTYERSEEVMAWRRYVTDGDYISCCVVDDGTEDTIWNIVAREGSYYLEKEKSRNFVGTDYWCLDSAVNKYLAPATVITDVTLDSTDVVVTSPAHGLADGDHVRIRDVVGMVELNNNVYTVADKTDDTFKLKFQDGSAYIVGTTFTAYDSGGTATQVSNTIDGLDHLEGKLVGVTADGLYDGDHEVEDGEITLNGFYNRIVAGLKYDCTVSPMPIEPDLMDRSPSGKQKLVSGKVKLKLKDTIGGSFGSIIGRLEFLIPETTPPLGTAWTPVNADIEVYNADGWEDIKRVYFKQTIPMPAEILSMSLTMDVRA